MANKKSKTSTGEIYVVVENSFEYNDEYYYRSGDGGIPKVYFTSKQEAEERCQQLNEYARSSASAEDYNDGYNDSEFSLDNIVFYEVFTITLGE